MNINLWHKLNKNVLLYLYNFILDFSKKKYKIKIINSQKTYNNFIRMMYNESDKTIIDKRLYPEFFNKTYNSLNDNKYIVL